MTHHEHRIRTSLYRGPGGHNGCPCCRPLKCPVTSRNRMKSERARERRRLAALTYRQENHEK